MSTDHDSYEKIARRPRDSAEFREGYEDARRAFLIGQAVRERRLALSRLEAGGTVPTIPVLERIAAALGAELIVTIAPPAA